MGALKSYYWLGGAGNLQDAENWYDPYIPPPGYAVPGPGIDAEIDNNGTLLGIITLLQITIHATVTIDAVTNVATYAIVGDYSNGTVYVNGGSWTENGVLGVGNNSASGALYIENGGVVTDGGNVAFGELAGGNGTLNISTAGTLLTGGAYGWIGNLAGSSGTASVDGTGSKWTMAASLFLGTQSGSTGSLTVSDGGSIEVAGEFHVAESGDAMVTIESGSTFSSLGSINVVGNVAAALGTVTIDGTDSVWKVANDLTIGNAGTGIVDVSSGGALLVGGNLSLGQSASGIGTLSIDASSFVEVGSDAGPIAGDLAVASGHLVTGTGTIDGSVQLDGSLEAVGGLLVITGDLTGSGTIEVAAGATLAIDGTLADSIDDTFLGAGEIILGSSLLSADQLDIADGGTLDLEGSTGATDTVDFQGAGHLVIDDTQTATTASISSTATVLDARSSENSQSTNQLTVDDYQDSDVIDIGNQTDTTYAPTSDALNIFTNFSLSEILDFVGSITAISLEPTNDGNNVTEIIPDTTDVAQADPNPAGFSINWSFIHGSEGNRLIPYVPMSGSSGSVLGHSGVTIGYGVDLANGPLDQSDFDQLFPNWRQNPNLTFLANATSVSVTGASALAYLNTGGVQTVLIGNGEITQSTSVSITQSQANAISNLAETYTLDDLISTWNTYSSVPLTYLPPQAQTVLLDVAYQYGAANLPSKTPTFWGLMLDAAESISETSPQGTSSVWDEVVGELQDFGDRYQTRRQAEANLLKAIPIITNPPSAPIRQPPVEANPLLLPYNFETAIGVQYTLLASGTDFSTISGSIASAPSSPLSTLADETIQTAQFAYTLTEASGSPEVSSLKLPGEGAAKFVVNAEIGGVWTTLGTEEPLADLDLPQGVTSLSVIPLSATGLPTIIDPDFAFEFCVTFSSAGTFSGTVSIPSTAFPQTYIWALAPSAAGGFSDPGSWSDITSGTSTPASVAPTASDTVEIDVSGATVEGSGTASEITFDSIALLAGTVAAGTSIKLNGTLTLADAAALTTPVLNAATGSDLDVQTGATVTVSGTLSSPTDGFLSAASFGGNLTVDGGEFDAGGQVNFGVSTGDVSSVVVEDGGTLSAWALFVTNSQSDQGSMLITGIGTTVTVLGGPVPNSTNDGGYLVIGSGYPSGLGSTGTLTVTSDALLASQSGQIGNDLASGNANVSDGGTWDVTTSNGLSVGGDGSGPGSLTVASSGLVQVDGYLTVGGGTSGGTGVLSILAGGTVADTGNTDDGGIWVGGFDGNAAGTLIVQGTGALLNPGTSWLLVGNHSRGTLNVGPGGVVTTGTDVTVGQNTGSGLLTVSGSGARLNVGTNLNAGLGGSGTVDIEAGGVVEVNTSGQVSYSLIAGLANSGGNGPTTTGNVTVSGTGSELIDNGALGVGWVGTGELDVLSGGVATFTAPNMTKFDSLLLGFSADAAGLVHVTGGTIKAGSNDILVGFQGSGTFDVSGAGRVDAGSGFLVGWLPGGTGSVDVDGAGSTLTINNYFLIGGYTADGGSGIVDATNRGAILDSVDLRIHAGSTLSIDSTSSIELGNSADAVAGSIVVDAGFRLLGAGMVSGPVDLYGTAEATGGTLEIADAVSSSGTLQIDADGTLKLDAGAPFASIAFQGAGGTLDLATAHLGGGTIGGFAAGSEIVVADAVGASDSIAVGGGVTTLDLFSGVTGIGSLDFAGTPTLNFDSATGIVTVACFATGTHILTEVGEVPVEQLRPGVRVRTADGKLVPIRWLGHSRIQWRDRDPLHTLPVRIAAGALGQGLPCRDLLVSPGHAVFLDGLLVHAGALVNGSSVTYETRVPEVFTYWHIELDTHELVLAEGIGAESFMEGAEPFGFDNWCERTGPIDARELPYPRCKARRQLPRAIAARLSAWQFGSIKAAA